MPSSAGGRERLKKRKTRSAGGRRHLNERKTRPAGGRRRLNERPTPSDLDRKRLKRLRAGFERVRPPGRSGKDDPVHQPLRRRSSTELAELTGDAGGRKLLPRHRSRIVEVEVEDPLELADVDTEEDLRRLEKVLKERSGSTG